MSAFLNIDKIAAEVFGEAAQSISACSGKSLALEDRERIAGLANDVELPQRTLDKLVQMAEHTDIFELEQQETIILSHAMHAWPGLADILPVSFQKKIRLENPQGLNPKERAAIIVTAFDYQPISNCHVLATAEDKYRARFVALAYALREGGGDAK